MVLIIYLRDIIDLLMDLKPEAVTLQLPPDLPMFIRVKSSDNDYLTTWKEFLEKGKDVSFYVNPRP
jgi:hypothetical protein